MRVAEVYGGVSLASYAVDEFVAIARALRVRCSQPLVAAAVKMHIALEQWRLIEYAGASVLGSEECAALFADAHRALAPLADASTLLLSFAQVSCSFPHSPVAPPLFQVIRLVSQASSIPPGPVIR